MKNKSLFTILASLLVFPIWTYLFLKPFFDLSASTSIGLLSTIVVGIFIRKFTHQKKHSRIYALFLPSLYIFGSFLNPVAFFSQIPIAFSIYAIFIFIRINKVVSLGFITLVFLYSFCFYPKIYISKIETGDLKIENTIANYQFIDIKMNERNILENGIPQIIITWNENCGKCKQLIKDLDPTLEDLKGQFRFDINYLYCQPNKDFENYSHLNDQIEQTEKIVIDKNNNFYKDKEMQGVPYSLIIDKNGKIMNYYVGYNQHLKKTYQKHFKNEIIDLY